MNIGFARVERSLVFLAEEAVFAEPTEGSFAETSLWQNDESFHVVGAFDHFNVYSGFGFDIVDDFPLVDSIDPHLFQRWIFSMCLQEHSNRPITILNGCRRYPNDENETHHVHEQMALSPVDFFSQRRTPWVRRRPLF